MTKKRLVVGLTVMLVITNSLWAYVYLEGDRKKGMEVFPRTDPSSPNLQYRTINFTTQDFKTSDEEWWIEVEITPNGGKQEVNDEILLLLYDDFLSYRWQIIKSWHFFREPTLRFRIELVDRDSRDIVAAELRDFLDSIDLVSDHYFSKHGERVESLDDGYLGEYDQYKRMWPYQKKLWEWGSEMTVEAIKELKETGANDPSREYQLERIFHLLSNQLSPGYEMERIQMYLYLTAIAIIVALVVLIICGVRLSKIRAQESSVIAN
jgi:hypothetical protein